MQKNVTEGDTPTTSPRLASGKNGRKINSAGRKSLRVVIKRGEEQEAKGNEEVNPVVVEKKTAEIATTESDTLSDSLKPNWGGEEPVIEKVLTEAEEEEVVFIDAEEEAAELAAAELAAAELAAAELAAAVLEANAVAVVNEEVLENNNITQKEESNIDSSNINSNVPLSSGGGSEKFVKEHPWPDAFEAEDLTTFPDLTSSGPEVEQWVVNNEQMLARTVTWNLAANAPPPVEEVKKILLPSNRYHLYIVGSEECERSIAASAVNPSKREWEKYLGEALGDMYMPLRAHTLQAIHIIVFAHKGIAHLVGDMSSGCIATGMGGTLGNKGAVALHMRLGPNTTFTCVNSHLSAHQNAVKQRNIEFNKVNKTMSSALSKRFRRSSSFQGDPLSESNKDFNCSRKKSLVPGIEQDLCDSADRIIFMGDMNYRIRGNRPAVDKLLALNMHDVMLSNDQLKWSMEQGLIPCGESGFIEPPLLFRPTYKYDFGTDIYDTGKSQRIPSWTDRILYHHDGMECISYNAENELKTSDHRPVYATFRIKVDFHEQHVVSNDAKRKASIKDSHDFTSESQVCTIS
jgi:hypothetical protein